MYTLGVNRRVVSPLVLLWHRISAPCEASRSCERSLRNLTPRLEPIVGRLCAQGGQQCSRNARQPTHTVLG
jgi:hypothetical protein